LCISANPLQGLFEVSLRSLAFGLGTDQTQYLTE
jgi:hypothetical protein